MPEPLINIDECLAEIPGDNPAGDKDAFYLIRDELDEARKELDPADFDESDPTRPTEPKPSDWAKVIKVGVDALATRCKHLEIAVRVAEALAKQHGFPGLADGLTLVRRMVGDCWDRIYPAIEDPGDEELRTGPIELIGLANGGFYFPPAVRNLPLVDGKAGAFSWERVAGKKADREGYDAAVAAAPVEKCQATADALSRSLTELAELGKVLKEKMGKAAPSVYDLTAAVNDCFRLARDILKQKGPMSGTAPADVQPPENSDGDNRPRTSTQSGGWAAAAEQAEVTRQGVYQQLRQAADLLEKLEPRSPVPYLVRRAVALGNLPFPELLKVLVRDANAMAEITREYGLDQVHGG